VAVLVDTSVWIDHLRSADEELVSLLGADSVLVHPMVIGELALGRMRQRREVIALLSDLPAARGVLDHEVLAFIEQADLAGRAASLVDVHLLASTLVTEGAQLWTHDKRLRSLAADHGACWRANR
jgi:predicted nucleic acid-binding protein